MSMRRARREINFPTRDGCTRLKVLLVSAVQESRNMDALEMVYVLLEHDPDSEMLTEYKHRLEAVAKAECQAKEEDGSSSDSDSDSDSGSSSSSSSSDSEDSDGDEGAAGSMASLNVSSDEAEKKDDGDIIDKYRRFEPEAFKENAPGQGEANSSDMTAAQAEKFGELKSMFSSLRAEVADRNDEERELWDTEANIERAKREISGSERK